ncbi:hypothetical protein LCGC14_2490690, partial [marine sediment metagenome]
KVPDHIEYNENNGLEVGTMIHKNQFIVVCHYAMRRWERSHYGSWQLYGHSHGRLEPIGLQHDVGVDNNNFYPVSLIELVEIMKHRTQHTIDDN